MRFRKTAVLFLLGGTAAFVSAETVTLRDGSVRQGTIESRSTTQLRMRVEDGGMRITVVIPMIDVARIDANSSAAPLPAASVPVAPPPATAPKVAATRAAPFTTYGFMGEMAASVIGKGPDDPERLPPATRKLWDAAQSADVQGKRADTLDALRILEESVHDVPGGTARLEAVSKRERNEGFGAWMARIHWDLIAASYKTGQFDLQDVREPERAPLDEIFRQKTAGALEPLRQYFPPTDPKTGAAEPFKPAQLAGITAANAIELKDKALLAAAVLVGQIKLEPAMASIDRQLLLSQLATVNRALARARELEPAARMAMAKAEAQRKAAEEKLQHDAAVQKQRTTLGSR